MGRLDDIQANLKPLKTGHKPARPDRNAHGRLISWKVYDIGT